MNLDDTLALLAALKDSGAVRFRSRDIEVHFRRGKPVVKPHKPAASSVNHLIREAVDPAYSAENTEKAEALIDTLRDPEKLIDSIFPDGAGG